jgi:hypothetical protein
MMVFLLFSVLRSKRLACFPLKWGEGQKLFKSGESIAHEAKLVKLWGVLPEWQKGPLRVFC